MPRDEQLQLLLLLVQLRRDLMQLKRLFCVWSPIGMIFPWNCWCASFPQ
jgi:hypothetical protein